MRAEITKNGEITVVRLEGQISFDTIPSFRDHCMNKLKGEKVIFDLAQLNFVGSTGITSFFEIIKDLVELKVLDLKFCSVKTEFQRLLLAWFSDHVEIYELKEHALHAFLNPMPKNTPLQPIRVPNFRLTEENFVEPIAATIAEDFSDIE
jgi:anti-anti-sigma factor